MGDNNFFQFHTFFRSSESWTIDSRTDRRAMERQAERLEMDDILTHGIMCKGSSIQKTLSGVHCCKSDLFNFCQQIFKFSLILFL